MSNAIDLALKSIPLRDLHECEHVALEITQSGLYDTNRHPRVGLPPLPIYERTGDSWRLMCARDELFSSVGAAKQADAILAYLATMTHIQLYADFDVDAYNAQAGDNALVPGIDYCPETRCLLNKNTIGGKEYYLVDGITYSRAARGKDPESLVEVVTFNSMRASDIQAEEQRECDELFAKQPCRLSVDCEAAQFAISMIVHDAFVLQCDIEQLLYVLKQASSTRIYLLYAADKAFFAKMSPKVLEFHTSPVSSCDAYTHIDNLTITVSALLLELLHDDQEARRVEREALVAHNLDVATAKGLVRSMRGTEYRYIELEPANYEHYREAFRAMFNRYPHADLLY